MTTTSRTAGKGRITGGQLRVGDVLTEYGGVTVVEIVEDQHIANGEGGTKIMGRRIRTSPPWNPPNEWMSAGMAAPYIVADTARRKDKTVDPEPDPNSPFWFSCPVCDKQLKGKRSTEVVPRHNHKLSPGKPCDGVGKTWTEAAEFRRRQLAEWEQSQRWSRSSSTSAAGRVRMSAMNATASDAIEARGICSRCHAPKVLSGGGVICAECATAVEEGGSLGRMEGSTHDSPPPIADGFVVVKVDSHRATDKLGRLVGPSLSYGRWDSEGIYHVIPEEHLAEAVTIKGVTHVKRPESHLDHHFHWGQDQSIPGLVPRTSVALVTNPAPPVFDAEGNQIAPMPWVRANRVRMEDIAARYASVTPPPACPNCGGKLYFMSSEDEATQARYEDTSPWTCPGCGMHGTDEDLRSEASAGWESVGGFSELRAERLVRGGVVASIHKEDWVWRWAVKLTGSDTILSEGMAPSAAEAKDEAEAAMSSAPVQQPLFAYLHSIGSTGSEQGVHIFEPWDFDHMVATHGADGRPIQREALLAQTGQEHVGSMQRMIFKALGEQKAPPEVDTLRDEQCPVCGETDAYSGDDCAVCGFVKPPDLFTDPDIDKAKEVNLRQDQQDQEDAGLTPEGNPAPGSGLEQFRVDGPGAPGAAPSTGKGLERFKVAAGPGSGYRETIIHPPFTDDDKALAEMIFKWWGNSMSGVSHQDLVRQAEEHECKLGGIVLDWFDGRTSHQHMIRMAESVEIPEHHDSGSIWDMNKGEWVQSFSSKTAHKAKLARIAEVGKDWPVIVLPEIEPPFTVRAR